MTIDFQPLTDFLAQDPWLALCLMAALVVLGGAAGFTAGLLGIGGGTIIVPGLLGVFAALGFGGPYLMHTAIGTSFAIMITTGISSARSHWKRDAVDFGVLRHLGPGLLVGVVVGTLIARQASTDGLMLFFAAALMLMAALMFFDPSRRQRVVQSGSAMPYPGFAGATIGVISSLMGIGGTALSVPYMTLCGVPIKRAVGTASALGLAVALPALAGYCAIGVGQGPKPPFTIGFINVFAWLCIMPFAAVSAPLGARFAHALPVNALRRIFASFLMLVAFKMAWETQMP